MAECEALKNIRHRNLVKVLTSCSSVDFKGDHFKALVLEFMPNGSLEKWLHPQDDDSPHHLMKLSLIQRLNIAIDVASALEYLHHDCQTPVIHRDLKPSNVLLDSDMIAHVGDFGLARLLRESDHNSQNQSSSAMIKGTIGYVAPEYGMGGEASTQGDVYSYGILLLEMFTGKRPTDDMFMDNVSLPTFAKKAFPDKVMEIVDPILLSEEDGSFEDAENIRAQRGRIQECLIVVVRTALDCSAESPRERMDMRNVAIEMQEVRDMFVGAGIHGHRRNMTQLLSEGPSYHSDY